MLWQAFGRFGGVAPDTVPDNLADLWANGEAGDWWRYDAAHTNAATIGANLTQARGVAKGLVANSTSTTPTLNQVLGIQCMRTSGTGAMVYNFGVDLTQPGTVVVAVGDSTTGAQNYATGSAALKRWQISCDSSDNIIAYAGTALDSAMNAPIDPSKVLMAEFNGASSKFYSNGIQVATGNAGSQATDELRVGTAYDGTGGTALNTYAVLIINRLLTASEKTRVNNLFSLFAGLT